MEKSLNTFKKNERLCSKKILSELTEKGITLYQHPFRFNTLITSLNITQPAQIVIAVPKRNFKKAVDRNKIKRRIKEAYRKNKYLLYEHLTSQNKKMAILLIYTAKEELTYHEIESKLILTLQHYIKSNEKHN